MSAVAPAVKEIQIGDRLTVAGRDVTSFAHAYWTKEAPAERVCRTLRGKARCTCGLFALTWMR